MTTAPANSLHLVCFSHLRWNFVYQRPQHLMARFARNYHVHFIEEPIFDSQSSYLEVASASPGVALVVPHLSPGISEEDAVVVQRELLAGYFIEKDITQYIFWYYTPMAIAVSDQFNPLVVVYDCMDELSAFKYAPPGLQDREKALLRKADLVFTGGYSLYEAKKNRHPDVHAFPSSIDVDHFYKARLEQSDPVDQALIPHPRIGYFGVIDERMDLTLIEEVARRKPAWQIVMIGPVCKIGEDSLPRQSNIHYLGMKSYEDLPAYVSGWGIAMLPFAMNEATKYISPTKTPEYLAAGRPVVSVPIADVLRQYGRNGLVGIAGTSDDFVRLVSTELSVVDRTKWLEQVDEFLSNVSWDKTWQCMMYLITRKLMEKERNSKGINEQIYV